MRTFLFVATIAFLFSCGSENSIPYSDSATIDSLNIGSVLGDTVLIPEIVTYDFTSFVPEKYVIKDSVIGDLNRDEFPDAILVLIRDDEDWMDERGRPVLILLGDSSGEFQLALRNDHLTPSKQAGQMYGEPYNGIKIDSGTFVIMHYGGSRFRWTYDYQFEYDTAKQNWYYTANYASIGDMLGEMNDLDSTGNCIPYDRDTLILKRKVDITKFDYETADIADLEY